MTLVRRRPNEDLAREVMSYRDGGGYPGGAWDIGGGSRGIQERRGKPEYKGVEAISMRLMNRTRRTAGTTRGVRI